MKAERKIVQGFATVPEQDRHAVQLVSSAILGLEPNMLDAAARRAQDFGGHVLHSTALAVCEEECLALLERLRHRLREYTLELAKGVPK